MRKICFYLLIYLSFAGSIQANTTCQQKTKEKRIPAVQAELFCRIMGKGAPIIVLHGGAGYITQDYLLPHMTALAENNCVVFYDQRALGHSTGEPIAIKNVSGVSL